jgi:nucleotide-binding universal stress UspA family protein
MHTQILIPLDGSALAEGALPLALPLARAMAAEVILLQVVSPPPQVDPMTGWPSREEPASARRQEIQDAAREYLTAVAGRLAQQGARAQVVVVEGDPIASIIAYAELRPQIRLIAMASHGRSGLSRLVFGSVTEGVLHGAPAPLLVTRQSAAPAGETSEPIYRTLLVPLDGSVFAEQALAEAEELAAATQGRLVLVAAVADPQPPPGATPVETPRAQAHDRQVNAARVRNYLESTAQRLEAGGHPVEIHLAHDRPAEAILRVAEECAADLIVMATHGRNGLARLRMGSVALSVAQAARPPVCLVRPRPQPVRICEPAPAGRAAPAPARGG